jgi:hypothetical protein
MHLFLASAVVAATTIGAGAGVFQVPPLEVPRLTLGPAHSIVTAAPTRRSRPVVRRAPAGACPVRVAPPHPDTEIGSVRKAPADVDTAMSSEAGCVPVPVKK